jgi:hypothetical protein
VVPCAQVHQTRAGAVKPQRGVNLTEKLVNSVAGHRRRCAGVGASRDADPHVARRDLGAAQPGDRRNRLEIQRVPRDRPRPQVNHGAGPPTAATTATTRLIIVTAVFLMTIINEIAVVPASRRAAALATAATAAILAGPIVATGIPPAAVTGTRARIDVIAILTVFIIVTGVLGARPAFAESGRRDGHCGRILRGRAVRIMRVNKPQPHGVPKGRKVSINGHIKQKIKTEIEKKKKEKKKKKKKKKK